MKINVKIPKKINIGGIKTGTSPYKLPIASKDTLGGIKVGNNLTIEEDGTLNAIQPIQEIEVQGEEITLKDYKKATDFKLYGNSVQNGTPSLDNPVAIKNVGTIDKSGYCNIPISYIDEKNISLYDLCNVDKSGTIDGVDYVVNEDGSITLNGTSNANFLLTTIDLANKTNIEDTFFEPGLYTCTTDAKDEVFQKDGKTGIMVSITPDDASSSSIDKNTRCAIFEITKQTTSISFSIMFVKGFSFNNETLNFTFRPCAILTKVQEPLRKVGDVADYIDFVNKKVYRNIEVLDDTGTKTIDESYRVLDTPIEEDIIDLYIGNIKDKTLSSDGIVKPTLYCKYDTIYKNSFKTINGQSIEGEGNIVIEGGSGGNYEPNVMCLEMSKEQIFSEKTYAKIEFDVATKIGDKLIFENNEIKIGAGVEYIKVSVITNPKSSKLGNAYVRVIKNYDGTLKNTVSWIFDKVATDWGVKCLILPPKLLKVQEGDIIALFVYTEGSGSVGPGNGAETALTVEVVK